MTELKKYVWKRPIYIEITTFVVVLLFLANTVYSLLKNKASDGNIPLTIIATIITILVVLYDIYTIKKSGKTTLKVYEDRITIQIWNNKETVITKSNFKDVNIPRYNEGIRINLKDGTTYRLSLRGLRRDLITDLVTALVTFNVD